MGELVREFNSSQADIEVTYEPIPGQYYPKLLAMLVSRTAPDVFYLDVLWFKPFLAKQKILLSLEPFLAKSTTKKEDFIAPLVDAFSDPGHELRHPQGLQRARALLQQGDVRRRGHSVSRRVLGSLERLRQAAKKLTKPGGPYGLVLNHDRVDRYLPIANMFGAELFSATAAARSLHPRARGRSTSMRT